MTAATVCWHSTIPICAATARKLPTYRFRFPLHFDEQLSGKSSHWLLLKPSLVYVIAQPSRCQLPLPVGIQPFQYALPLHVDTKALADCYLSSLTKIIFGNLGKGLGHADLVSDLRYYWAVPKFSLNALLYAAECCLCCLKDEVKLCVPSKVGLAQK